MSEGIPVWTVGALVTWLQTHDPACLVIVAGDAAGNRYGPLGSAWVGAYAPVSDARGQMGLQTLTVQDQAEGYTAEDVVAGVPAVCLVPRGGARDE